MMQKDQKVAKNTMIGAEQIAVMGRLNQVAAAWLAGLSPRTLRDAPLQRDEAGRYDARVILDWEASRRAPATSGEPSAERYTPDQLRRQKALADICEMARDKQRGKLMDRAEFERTQIEIAITFKRSLEGLGRQMAMRLVGQPALEIERIIKERCHDILLCLATTGEPPVDLPETEGKTATS
jgi:hypothetical protein